MKTNTKLDVAFAALRKDGIIARKAFSCCGGCAGYELATKLGEMPEAKRAKVMGCVFYTRQDNARVNEHFSSGRAARWARPDDKLFLAFGQITHHDEATKTEYATPLETIDVGQRLAMALRAAGVKFEWDGNPATRIGVNIDSAFSDAEVAS